MSELSELVNIDWSRSNDRLAWLGKDINLESITRNISSQQASMLRLMSKVERSIHEIKRSDFDHPLLNTTLADAVTEVKRGCGVVILRGFDLDELSMDEKRRLYWGVGTHFGRGLSQSRAGDMIGDVTPRQGTSRAYTSDRELTLHTDATEIVGLFCLQSAKTGGENILVSSLALRAVMESERPDLVPILQRGFRTWRSNEQLPGQEPITPYRVPVFGEKDGVKSLWQGWQLAAATAEFVGESLTREENEAIDYVLEVLDREEMHLLVRLEAGDMLIFSNFDVMHSRRAFVQWEDPERTRHLMRLWLQTQPARPLPSEMIIWPNPSGLLGHDPSPREGEELYTKRGSDEASLFMYNYFRDFFGDPSATTEKAM